MGIPGYDTWKTASPYDDDIDYAELYDLECTECGYDDPDIDDNMYPVLDCECPHCGYRWTLGLTDEEAPDDYDYDHHVVFGITRTYDDPPIFADS